MKHKTLFLLFCLCPLLIFGHSVGKHTYTSREKALELAKLLDKGEYKGLIIRAAYVLNDKNGFYVAVTLTSGQTERWYMDHIYEYSKKEHLVLNDNKSLIFNPKDLSGFYVFDKNKFHRQGLQANLYRRFFEDNDALAGKNLIYEVKEFALLPPRQGGKLAKRGADGYAHRYKLALENGEHLFFTLPQAYTIFTNGQLLRASNAAEEGLGRMYTITSIRKHEKQPLSQGFSTFGLELGFDWADRAVKGIRIDPENFVVEIYERTYYRKNGTPYTKFVVDIVIPNTNFELPQKYQTLKNFEYFESIGVRRGKNKFRTILRGTFNTADYRFLDIPPVVSLFSRAEKNDSLLITFFSNYDQSTGLSPEELRKRTHFAELAAGKVAANDGLVRGAATAKKKKKKRDISDATDGVDLTTSFGRSYRGALEHHNQALLEQDALISLTQIEESANRFEAAALLATTDREFRLALDKRNSVNSELYAKNIAYVKEQLEQTRYDEADLKARLDKTAKYARTERQRNEVGRLLRQVQLTMTIENWKTTATRLITQRRIAASAENRGNEVAEVNAQLMRIREEIEAWNQRSLPPKKRGELDDLLIQIEEGMLDPAEERASTSQASLP